MCLMCLHLKAKYQNTPPKAVVGVDQPTYALSWHKHKPYMKNCLSSHSCHFVNFVCTKLLHAYVQCVNIVKAKEKIVLPKVVVGVDRPVNALS